MSEPVSQVSSGLVCSVASAMPGPVSQVPPGLVHSIPSTLHGPVSWVPRGLDRSVPSALPCVQCRVLLVVPCRSHVACSHAHAKGQQPPLARQERSPQSSPPATFSPVFPTSIILPSLSHPQHLPIAVSPPTSQMPPTHTLLLALMHRLS
eukprot:365863-Chlamydomonas_euryale.AAC.7